MSKKDEEMGKASFSGVDEAVKEKYVFGKYRNADKAKSSGSELWQTRSYHRFHRHLWDQTLRVREVMSRTDPDFPQRKRKLQQFLKDNLKREAQKLCDEQSEAKIRSKQLLRASSSCVHDMTDSIENLHKRILLNSLSSGSLLTSEDNIERLPYVSSIMDNVEHWYQSNRITSFIVDITGTFDGLNPVTPEIIPQEPESLHMEDSSNSSNLEESRYDCVLSQSNRLVKFLGDQFERMAVPVGHYFQADVPEWTGPSSEVCVIGDSDNSRWLGTKVWAIGRQNVKATSRALGKGRPSSCSCASPGSSNCVSHNILEKRQLLQSDLGPLFHI